MERLLEVGAAWLRASGRAKLREPGADPSAELAGALACWRRAASRWCSATQTPRWWSSAPCSPCARRPAHEPGLLRHHADLLRQRRAPHRPHLHDGRRRHARALPPALRRADLLPDRHRRARREDRRGGRSSAAPRRKQVADQYSAAFHATWQQLGFSFDRFIRTTDPDHVRDVQAVLQRLCDAGRDRLPASTKASTASAASASSPSATWRAGCAATTSARPRSASRGELLLPDEPLLRLARRAHREAPGLHPPRALPQRGARHAARRRRARRPLHLAAEVAPRRGASSCPSTPASSATCGSTR